MAGGGQGSSGGPPGGGLSGLISGLVKPIMTGRGDLLGLMPEKPGMPPPQTPGLEQQAPMAPQLSNDRLAFLRLFGGFGGAT